MVLDKANGPTGSMDSLEMISCPDVFAVLDDRLND